MGRSSTKAKGEKFERKVARRLRQEFRAGRFGSGLMHTRILTKPEFHSRDRGANIVFDLAAEFRLGPSGDAFFTIVIECKDYAGTIPVDDLEEFKAKLDQCFGKNVKGMFATSAALQSGALNYARSQGICVVRMIDNGDMDIMAACVRGGKAAFQEAVDQMVEEKAADAEEAVLDYEYAALDCTFGLFDTFIVDGSHEFARLGDALSHIQNECSASIGNLDTLSGKSIQHPSTGA